MRLLGATLWKNAYHLHIEIAKDGRRSILTEKEIESYGYKWRMVSTCSAVLTYDGIDYPLFCFQSDTNNVLSGKPRTEL